MPCGYRRESLAVAIDELVPPSLLVPRPQNSASLRRSRRSGSVVARRSSRHPPRFLTRATMTTDRKPGAPQFVSASTADALLAAMMLAVGSSTGGHLLFLFGLPLTVAGFVVACRAVRNYGRPEPPRSLSSTYVWLTVMATWGIVSPSTGDTVWYEVLRRTYPVAGIFFVGLFASGEEKWQRRATVGAVVLGVLVCAAAPFGSPDPPIDVFAWTQTSVQALLRATHPYTVLAPDVYHGRYDPGYTVSVYPYMPATLLAYAPWVGVLGDFRFALPACLLITIGLIHAIGRRLALDPQVTRLAMLALVLHPSGPRMMESGWTEPLLLTGAAAFVYLTLRKPGGVGQAAAFFLLPALKQYVIAPLFMYLSRLRPHERVRALVTGGSVGALTIVPFLIWNWHATFSGITFQMEAPTGPRLGSTSLVALMAVASGVYPARWASVATQMIVGGIAWLRLRNDGLGGLVLASALSLYATFLVGWQAFVNYYYFIGGLLILAAMLSARAEATA
jgi:hypothetical protein